VVSRRRRPCADARCVPIDVAYDPPAECPARAARTPRSRRAARASLGASSPALAFRVLIEPSWRARIEARDAAGERSVRELSGETPRVVAALLIVAVLADPTRRAKPRARHAARTEAPAPRAPTERRETTQRGPSGSGSACS
jgi:hypothetical protein